MQMNFMSLIKYVVIHKRRLNYETDVTCHFWFHLNAPNMFTLYNLIYETNKKNLNKSALISIIFMFILQNIGILFLVEI